MAKLRIRSVSYVLFPGGYQPTSLGSYALPVLLGCWLIAGGQFSVAQEPVRRNALPRNALPRNVWGPAEQPSPEAQAKADALIDWIVEPEITLDLDPRRSKIVRTKLPVSR
ncbi:hypothetical protein LCGC14_2355680, partial [marine sediment metagenome]